MQIVRALTCILAASYISHPRPLAALLDTIMDVTGCAIEAGLRKWMMLCDYLYFCEHTVLNYRLSGTGPPSMPLSLRTG